MTKVFKVYSSRLCMYVIQNMRIESPCWIGGYDKPPAINEGAVTTRYVSLLLCEFVRLVVYGLAFSIICILWSYRFQNS